MRYAVRNTMVGVAACVLLQPCLSAQTPADSGNPRAGAEAQTGAQTGQAAQTGQTGQTGAETGQTGQTGRTGQTAANANQSALPNAATAQARQLANRQALMNRYGAGYYGRPFFADPGVRQQLRLNDVQLNRLRQLYGNRYAQYIEQLSALRQQELQQTELVNQSRLLRQQLADDLAAGAGQVIVDPEVRQRFDQLNLQYQGLNAFNSPTVQEQLNLTARQTSQLDTLAEEMNAELAEVAEQYSDFPEQIPEQFERVRRNRDRELLSILGQERFQTWEGIIGPRYEFPASAYFPGLMSNNGSVPGTQNGSNLGNNNANQPNREEEVTTNPDSLTP